MKPISNNGIFIIIRTSLFDQRMVCQQTGMLVLEIERKFQRQTNDRKGNENAQQSD